VRCNGAKIGNGVAWVSRGRVGGKVAIRESMEVIVDGERMW